MSGTSESRMASKGSAREEKDTEVQGPREEVQQMMQDSQASLMNAMRNIVADFTRSNGQSEFGGVVGSAAARESPAGERPARETGTGLFLNDGDSKTFEALGRGDAVPVEVGPEWDQPGQPRRAGGGGLYPGGEFGGGFDLPSSRHVGVTHPVAPKFSG